MFQGGSIQLLKAEVQEHSYKKCQVSSDFNNVESLGTLAIAASQGDGSPGQCGVGWLNRKGRAYQTETIAREEAAGEGGPESLF